MKKVYGIIISLLVLLIAWYFFSIPAEEDDEITTIEVDLKAGPAQFSPNYVILHEDNIILFRNNRDLITGLKVYNYEENFVDDQLAAELFVDGINDIKLIDDSLYGLFENRANLFSGGKWIEADENPFQAPKNFEKLRKRSFGLSFADNKYKVYGIDAGEWGGSVIFEDRISGRLSGYNNPGPKNIAKYNDSYYIDGNSFHLGIWVVQVSKVSDPDKLLTITRQFLDNSSEVPNYLGTRTIESFQGVDKIQWESILDSLKRFTTLGKEMADKCNPFYSYADNDSSITESMKKDCMLSKLYWKKMMFYRDERRKKLQNNHGANALFFKVYTIDDEPSVGTITFEWKNQLTHCFVDSLLYLCSIKDNKVDSVYHVLLNNVPPNSWFTFSKFKEKQLITLLNGSNDQMIVICFLFEGDRIRKFVIRRSV